MVGNAYPAAQLRAVPYGRAPGYATKCRHDYIASHAAVVRDLAEVIDLGALPNESIVQHAAIHADMPAKPNPILQDHPPQMRHQIERLTSGNHAKATFANHAIRANPNPIAD
jgi:hypothetical protein